MRGDSRLGAMADRGTEPPLPPPELMSGVGLARGGKLELSYLVIGAEAKARIVELLGSKWSWRGRRVLDFGCGSGRLLRQFAAEAEEAEFHGSDISEPMVAWVRRHLCPPIAEARRNGEWPPLDYPDGHFDLITAISVFTHIADGWSDWLLEMQRLLKPDGLFVATILDERCGRAMSGLPWDERRVGMSAFGFADPEMEWPNVLHSHWWLREHWGRAFEILALDSGPQDDGNGAVLPQGWVLMRRREVELTPAELEREDPDDPRYGEARRFQYELLRAEGEQVKRRRRRLEGSSRSRLTAPLRRARAWLRRD
jgi:ubiquinone/menaquinone biosynthesis C-methylase UbiE